MDNDTSHKANILLPKWFSVPIVWWPNCRTKYEWIYQHHSWPTVGHRETRPHTKHDLYDFAMFADVATCSMCEQETKGKILKEMFQVRQTQWAPRWSKRANVQGREAMIESMVRSRTNTLAIFTGRVLPTTKVSHKTSLQCSDCVAQYNQNYTITQW